MPHTHLAPIRGINVGGKHIVPMAALRERLAEKHVDARTYIQSGNVLLTTDLPDEEVADMISHAVHEILGKPVDVVVFTADHWCRAIDRAPTGWGQTETFKHYILAAHHQDVVDALGKHETNPEIELLTPGDRVLYQQVSAERAAEAITPKLAQKPGITARNANTARTLARLLREGA